MKIVFLCGGIGKRMFPLAKDKFLMKFLGKELILHHLEMAEKHGLNQIVIVGNPQNIKKIKEVVGNKATYAVQKQPKGMADALLSAKHLISNDEILIVNPNDIFDSMAYETILTKFKTGEGDSIILGYKVKDYFPGGYLIVEDDMIKGIIEKPGAGNEPSDLINIVVHLHKDAKSLIKYLGKTKSGKDDIYEKAMDHMMKDGFDFRVAKYEGSWTAIKYPWHILDVIKHFLDKVEKTISENAAISEKATVEGDKIIIESGVKIFENAIVKGPCFIGKNTIIGNNALVREYCHLGENDVVGFSTEIKTSYIDDGSWFHMNYVGDSIIGRRCNLGAGTNIANLRLDGKNIAVVLRGEMVDTGLKKLGVIMGDDVKTGINSSIDPGTIIGEKSYIGPNSLARGNIAPRSRIH